MANVTLVDGHVPNYVNPPTKQPLVMDVQIGLTVTALLCVALRLYTRKVLRNVFGAEDWVIIVAMCLAIVATICTCLGCKLGGTGLHIWDIKPGVNHRLNAQFSYINQFFYQWILQLTKISILLFYTSLAQIRYFHRAAYSLIGISAAFALASTFVEIFQCSPVMKSVYGSLVHGKCILQANYFKASGFVNLILDIAVLALPIPLLWRLQAPIRQRIALIAIFLIGIFACSSSIVRLVVWYRVAGDGNRNNPDSTLRTRVDIVNWSCIEYCTALICASLPHLKPLVVKTIPGFFSSRYASKETAYPPANSRSKQYAFPVSSRDNTADAFYGNKRGRISNVVTGGDRTGISRLDNDSTEEIWGDNTESQPIGSDQKDWHIMKTINVNVNGAD